MPQFRSESLVLRSYNLAEADRIVVFFTRDHGVVRGVAKGAKRLKSRFGSMLEPFSNVDLTFFQKDDRELVSIQGIDLNRSFFESASNPEFLQTFAYVAELLIAFLPPHDPSEKVFRMTKACLETPIEGEACLAAVRLYFELWLLRLGGYLPDWAVCSECSETLGPNTASSLTPGFHLVCDRCIPRVRLTAITPTHRDLFYNVQQLAPPAFLAHATLVPSPVMELSAIMRRIISQVVGRDLLIQEPLAAAS